MSIALTLRHSGFLTGIVVAIGLLFLSASTACHAQAVIKGTADAVEVESQGSSLAEVFNGLCAKFNYQCRTSVKLDREVTGTFKGTALNVLSRLLRNYDYVVKVSDSDRVEVTVIKLSSKDSEKVIPERMMPPRPMPGPPPMPGRPRRGP